MYYWTERVGNLLAGYKTSFLIDEMIADDTLDKQRQPLLDFTISGRHKGYLLWLLMQAIHCHSTYNISRQVKMLCIWYPKKRRDWDIIHEEKDIIET